MQFCLQMYVKTKSHNEDEKRVIHDACNVVYKCMLKQNHTTKMKKE